MLNQRQRIIRALRLVQPVLSSVRGRRPKGMKPHSTDILAANLSRAVTELERALEAYPDQEGETNG